MAVCKCDTGGGNTGRPACFGTFDVTKQVILVEYFKPDGSVNGIDLSTLASGGTILDQAFLDERVKDVNPRTRWYPTPELKNVADERAENVTEDFEDTSTAFIQAGARTFNGLILKGDPILMGNLDTWRCSTIGVFYIDKSGNLIGANKRDGFLDPVRIQDDTFSANLVKTTDTTISKIDMTFTVSQLEDDAELIMLESVSITANLLGVNGLIDVVAGTPSSVTTTGFDVQLNTNFGGVLSQIPAEGMVTADFEMNELSPTPGPIVITSVTESVATPGLYTFVIPAQTSSDVLKISNPSTGPLDKNFDLTAFTVTIP